MAEQLGTVKTKFSRAYVYLNPDPFTGPNTWRLSNIIPIGQPEPEGGIDDIFTLLPIDKTEIGTTTNLFFNIAGLPTTEKASKNKSYLTDTINNFVRHLDNIPKRAGFSLSGLQGIDPVETRIQDTTGVIYLDLTNLPTLEDVRRHRLYNITPSTFKYNSRSVDVLTATEPVQSVTDSGTATVSLDFRNLPEA